MDAELASAGPQALQEHIALMIANDDQLADRGGREAPREINTNRASPPAAQFYAKGAL